MDLYTTFITYVAGPTQVIPCCCNEEVKRYRDFYITWNTTKKGETVVADCKGNGLIGKPKNLLYNLHHYIIIFVGNVTRTCGFDNQWQPAKIYCVREQIKKIFAEVSYCIANCSYLS